jgi:replicative DNA helicase
MFEKLKKIKRNQEVIEKQIIHYISIKGDKALSLFEKVQDNFFLDEKHKKIYETIKDGIINETNYTQKITKLRLASVYAECLGSEIVYFPERLVKDLQNNWLEYNLITLLENHSLKDIEDPTKTISELWGDLEKLTAYQDLEDVDFEHLLKLFKQEQQEYEKKDGELIGKESGFKSLDDAVDGIRDGHLWIVGAYTSGGKTQFVLNIANAFFKQKAKVSIYSLEMSKVDIFKRLLGIITGKNGSLLLKNNKTENVEARNKGIEVLKESELRVHTEKFNLDEIITSMVVEKKTKGVELFIIDYAQLIKTGGGNLYEDMRDVAIKLQKFCRTQNVPMILVSQISNESAKSGNSQVIGFKGAGDLSASADVAIELQSGEDKDEREEKIDRGESVKVEMTVKKNRHGRIFSETLWFQTQTGQFFNECPDLSK